jgi:Zn-dependent peptidase ImmA (M78 family)
MMSIMATEEIIKLAEQTAQQYNPEGLSPFPFERIQKDKKDLMIFTETLKDDLSGAIGYDKTTNRFDILLDDKEPKTHQYFALAHELGHYFLHEADIKKEGILIDEEPSRIAQGYKFHDRHKGIKDNPELDREADIFALTLILPEKPIRKGWEKLRSVEKLAKIFNVTLSEVSIRLEGLGLTE